MIDLAELAVGAAVAAIAVHLFHVHRADADVLRLYADLRSERERGAAQAAQLATQDARLAEKTTVIALQDELLAMQHELIAEQDAQLAHDAHELAQAQGREALAAANIVQLSGALMNAAAQARKPVAIGGDVSARFCRN